MKDKLTHNKKDEWGYSTTSSAARKKAKIINSCLRDANKIVVCIATGYSFGNFGDLLARYIVEKLSKKEVIKYLDNTEYHLCSVGSVLNRNTMFSNAVVWGSGFLSPQKSKCKIALTKIRQFLRGKFGRNLYLAVRGCLSRDILINSGGGCPSVYGDPALLMPKFYTPNTTKKYKLGIILHWKHERFKEMFSNIEGIKTIDINIDYNKINNFIDEVCQCNFILSSSLHGLIIANAYKIPCVRLKIIKNPIATKEDRDDFKFEDYLSGLNACKDNKFCKDYFFNKLLLNPNAKQNQTLINTVKIKANKPDFCINLNPLVHAFPFLDNSYKDTDFKI